MLSAIALIVAVCAAGDVNVDMSSDDNWHVDLPARKGQASRTSRGETSKRFSVDDKSTSGARLKRSSKADAQSDDYVLPPAVTSIYRARGYALPRHGGPSALIQEDEELGRGFVGNVKAKLEALQALEGIERRGIGESPSEQRVVQEQRMLGTGAYARLHDLHGPRLMNELNLIGLEIMQQYPVGTPVGTLRKAYSELIQFISERTGVSVARIYRVMDLESYGGQYWAHHPGGACGLVQVRPIALEEMQRLRPGEFNVVTFNDIRANPALNLYTGMSYAQEKGQDWNHYSGGARGYADYVLHGVPKGS